MDRTQVIDQLPALRRYARALTGDIWAADDLVQDTLERACAKWQLWLAGTDLRAWLFTLMHNLHANQRRASLAPGRVTPIDDVQSELPAPERETDSALDLTRCLQRLPDEQRAVLLLVALEDMAYADVAKVLGIPIGTVMSRLSRARSRLRELMEGETAAAPVARQPVPLRRMK